MSCFPRTPTHPSQGAEPSFAEAIADKRIGRRKNNFLALGILISLLFLIPAIARADITLATDGATTYRIVHAATATATGVDLYAAKTLAAYLQESTGAEFEIVRAGQGDVDLPTIFVGLSEPALALLEADPLAELKDQEHVARSIGADILLYGKGVHGNLNAVMEFLENSLGWRWYSVYEKPLVPKQTNLTLPPFHRTRGFDFKSRQLPLRYGTDFYLQKGLNMGFETKLLMKRKPVPPHLQSWMLNENFVHTSFSYIPPSPTARYAQDFHWLEKHNYFETNPEFFSLGANGKRVENLQLCYSNRGLRDELTKQVRKHIKISGERQVIMIDAADRPGRFCHCQDCLDLEQQYQTPGGPIFDFLIELCNTLKDEHPETLVKTLAYRRSQTQIPPKLPKGESLPDNLVIDFAPIEDCYFADWSHPNPAIHSNQSVC